MLPFEGRRSSVQLISEILRLLRLGEVGKTEVMYGVRLTHSQTQKYLPRLIELRLIEPREQKTGPPVYRITPKGLDILGKIEQLQELLHVDEVPEILEAPELMVDQEQDRSVLKRLRDAIRGKRTEPSD